MALVQKLHEQFSQPLSSDYWYTDTMQGVVVSGGYARVPTTQDPTIYVQPKWFKPDGSPLALYGKSGVNWGEIEIEYKITPRHQRQSGATNTNQMDTYLWNAPIDGSFRFLRTAFWSRTGTGTSTEFGLRFYSSADSSNILYEHTNVPVNTPIWLRFYLNKETGQIRFSTSNNGTYWLERYSGIDPHHITDGDASAYLTPQSGDANKYYDIDDFILRTSNSEIFIQNTSTTTTSDNLNLQAQHLLVIQDSVSTSSSTSPVPEEGSPKVPIIVYGFGGGVGSAVTFADSSYGITYKPTISDNELVIFNGFSETISERLALTQLHNIAILNARSLTEYENIPLTQMHNIFINDINSSSSIDNLLLNQNHILLADNLSSLSYVDSINLSTAAFLGILSASAYSYSELVNILQQHNLNINSSRSLLNADNVPIIHELTLLLNSSRSNTKFGSLKLTEDYNLSTDSMRSETYTDGLILSQLHNLSLNSGRAYSYADILQIYQFLLLNQPADGRSLTFSDTVTLVQQSFLLVDDARSRTKSNKISVIDWMSLSVQHGIYKPTNIKTGLFDTADLSNGIYKRTQFSDDNSLRASEVETGMFKKTSIEKKREL